MIAYNTDMDDIIRFW